MLKLSAARHSIPKSLANLCNPIQSKGGSVQFNPAVTIHEMGKVCIRQYQWQKINAVL